MQPCPTKDSLPIYDVTKDSESAQGLPVMIWVGAQVPTLDRAHIVPELGLIHPMQEACHFVKMDCQE